jgi:predicted RNA-binding protein with PIN domain
LKHSPGHCKTKKLLIDGFNLIYKFPELEEKMARRDLPAAMSGLLAILCDYRRDSGRTVRVVFDGKKREGDDLRWKE